ncbi:MAG: hypothetical protein EFT35_01845 [Methanophagales archaeon ANME-1-THS]|nr:MAG: hypothetical protein EFT35_01845 [Methanophagales archaeon ANME-1-THS]
MRGGFYGRKRPRTKLEILAEILLAARTGATKTEIVYQTNLNFQRARRYLVYLEGKGLLENSGAHYKSTERGNAFLRNVQSMEEILHP